MPRLRRRLVPLTALALSAVACPGTASARPIPPGDSHALADVSGPTASRHASAARHRKDRRRVVHARRAVHAALAQVGDAYAMGASGPSAFDCSGLARFAMARAGVALPRTSFAQARVGRPVHRDKVRRGDLVFFSTAGPGASHVGIVVGSGVAVSATSHGVIEHAISDAYWGAHYAGARRVI
jgi:cell wall-associated NlpC family hydrolase